MRHHKYNMEFKFVEQPKEFDKYTERELLQYCLGATMYTPGIKNIAPKIINNGIPGLTSIVICFEDACLETDVERAEENAIKTFENINNAIKEGKLSRNDIPLIFCRVRNVEQFKRFSEKLKKEHVEILTGINFPKFNSQNGNLYYEHLVKLNEKFGDILYGMPIIEESTVAYKESRIDELLKIKKCLDKYNKLILQIRVGATDFSSCFGVRRSVDYSIYDISVVREILSDIVNIFGRNNDYVISGPVWEYFRVNKEMMFLEIPEYDITDKLMKRMPIFNDEVDGLLREVIIDKANGFIGRTVIHPTHVKYVNALQAVTREEYDDACQILNTEGGVVKSLNENKMNEILPHTNWAKKTYMRAQAYGVIENEKSYFSLFSVNE